MSSLVHPEETTVMPDSYPTYREYRAGPVKDELNVTMSLYSYLDNDHNTNRLELLMKCRRFAWFVRARETGLVHVASNSCRQRWCPICSSSRSSYMVQNITPWAEHTNRLKFMTVTMKHSSRSLSEQISRLYSDFRKLRCDPYFKKLCSGGIWFFQIKLDADKQLWHPHIHCLIQSKFIPHKWLSAKWLSITKYSCVTDIRAVRNPKTVAKYVARYCARPVNLSEHGLEKRIEIFKAFHGRRLCGTWGKAKCVSLSPPKKIEDGLYDNIGNWSTVHEAAKTDSVALGILRAWADHVPITENESCIWYDDFLNDAPSISEIDYDLPRVKQSQFW